MQRSNNDKPIFRSKADYRFLQVMIYSKTYCPYSRRLKSLLTKYNIDDMKVIELNREDQMSEMQVNWLLLSSSDLRLNFSRTLDLKTENLVGTILLEKHISALFQKRSLHNHTLRKSGRCNRYSTRKYAQSSYVSFRFLYAASCLSSTGM